MRLAPDLLYAQKAASGGSDALRQMRETQAALGPEMIARIKGLVQGYEPATPIQVKPPASPAGMEPIDRKNNMLVIMKFLQMNRENKSVQTLVRTLLSEDNQTIH